MKNGSLEAVARILFKIVQWIHVHVGHSVDVLLEIAPILARLAQPVPHRHLSGTAEIEN